MRCQQHHSLTTGCDRRLMHGNEMDRTRWGTTRPVVCNVAAEAARAAHDEALVAKPRPMETATGRRRVHMVVKSEKSKNRGRRTRFTDGGAWRPSRHGLVSCKGAGDWGKGRVHRPDSLRPDGGRLKPGPRSWYPGSKKNKEEFERPLPSKNRGQRLRIGIGRKRGSPFFAVRAETRKRGDEKKEAPPRA